MKWFDIEDAEGESWQVEAKNEEEAANEVLCDDERVEFYAYDGGTHMFNVYNEEGLCDVLFVKESEA